MDLQVIIILMWGPSTVLPAQMQIPHRRCSQVYTRSGYKNSLASPRMSAESYTMPHRISGEGHLFASLGDVCKCDWIR